MKFLSLLCAFATIAVFQADSNRIIDGQAAHVGQFPWQVLISYKTANGWRICGGTLLSNRWVVTAAHCTNGALKYNMKLGGITKYGDEEGSIVVTARTVIVHPEYDGNMKNDIALLESSTVIDFNDRIQPVPKLPMKGNVVPEEMIIVVSGWGKTEDAGEVSEYLNYVLMTTITNSKCSTIISPVYESTLCAVGNPSHSACDGDSGGPAVVYQGKEIVLVGIVSYVDENSCRSGITGLVRTELYYDFIRDNTGI